MFSNYRLAINLITGCTLCHQLLNRALTGNIHSPQASLVQLSQKVSKCYHKVFPQTCTVDSPAFQQGKINKGGEKNGMGSSCNFEWNI